jgi:carbonic anhydrase
MRRALASTAVATSMALLTLGGPALSPTSADPPAEWSHNPGSAVGPPRWGDIGFPTCSRGTRQSPVNIETSAATRVGGPPLRLRYAASDVTLANTGHAVEGQIPAGVSNTLRVGSEQYELTQYHFHAPSEHAIDGVRADVEAHFVHANSAGDTAVVGVLYRIGPRPNKALGRILRSASATTGVAVELGRANPAKMFRGIKAIRMKAGGALRVRSFHAYDGSLTTPACTEGIRWSVLAEGGHVSSRAVAHLHEVIAQFPDNDGYPNNNRPLQPLNGRVVKHRGLLQAW